jgi:hypothetical protein
MLTPKGNNSAKHPTLRMTWKRALKIEKIARLSADPAGYTNEQIANHIRCTPQTIVLVRQLPEYHAKMIEVTSGITSLYDQDLRQDTDNAREELKSMVPSAMMVIRNALLSKNENIRLKAATEIFDREGSHAKISKSSVSITNAPEMRGDPSVVSNIMQLLASAPISNGSDLTALDVTLSGGFTSSAAKSIEDQAEFVAETEILDHLIVEDKKPN